MSIIAIIIYQYRGITNINRHTNKIKTILQDPYCNTQDFHKIVLNCVLTLPVRLNFYLCPEFFCNTILDIYLYESRVQGMSKPHEKDEMFKICHLDENCTIYQISEYFDFEKSMMWRANQKITQSSFCCRRHIKRDQKICFIHATLIKDICLELNRKILIRWL